MGYTTSGIAEEDNVVLFFLYSKRDEKGSTSYSSCSMPYVPRRFLNSGSCTSSETPAEKRRRLIACGVVPSFAGRKTGGRGKIARLRQGRDVGRAA